MKDSNTGLFIAIPLACLFVGVLIGNGLGLKTAEIRAVKNNAAEYQIDKTTGEVKFVWLTNK